MLTSSSPTLSRSLRHIVRRQSDVMSCHVIDGFTCVCRQTKVTCSTSQPLQQITINPNEQHKYSAVELVIGSDSATIYGQTFAPIKELYSPTARHIDFRIKFENFTHLRLAEPSLFNRVFPDQTQIHKTMAYEIYNQNARPEDNVNLFRNLDVDSLEVYSLYAFRGTFQELFDGSNIKSLRISGGELKSDLNQPFTGNVGRLEVAKQASSIDTTNFPLYPAHEVILNAYYVAKFDSPNPPNYDNVAELRVFSNEPIPADAFKDYPNINTLSVQAKEIDPNAFNGLNKLEKIIIKDASPNPALLQNIPTLKEIEISGLEDLGADLQCEYAQRLSQGRLAVQATPNGPACTCVIAYLQSATNQVPCILNENCAQSSCQTIRDNFDTNTNTFKKPPEIRRADGTNALEHRSPKVYTQAYQPNPNDVRKYQTAVQQEPLQDPNQSFGEPRSPISYDPEVGGGADPQPRPTNQPNIYADETLTSKTRRRKTKTSTTPTVPLSNDQGGQGQEPSAENPSDQGPFGQPSGERQPHHEIHPIPSISADDTLSTTLPVDQNNDQQGAGEPGPSGHDHKAGVTSAVGTNEASTPLPKKRMNWMLIIIIAAGALVAVIALILLIVFLRRRSPPKYSATPTTDTPQRAVKT
ncbi:unnamed protein product [Didymodactylos carnosus]|uniref:Uncharacterized protein n=1 Tax=Didymodactylos carnosus TaxID=1234261 RepID=A0A813S8D5_9BILA|nr:unnamed protein product [Didymodactylos carnosus]CAF0956216.1 unnamed protein product [Didymodactylos carnosus]CAF3580191.1 unnamed protein product [Didymodactylos carnosus]CAF3729374.1 unnamed protein product [Didymodactylos carnosus]